MFLRSSFLKYYISQKLTYILNVINCFLFKDEPIAIKKTTTENLVKDLNVVVPLENKTKEPIRRKVKSESTRMKLSMALKGRKHSDDRNRKLSISGTKYYSDPSNRKRMQDIAVSKGLTIPVKINKKLYCSMSEAARQLNLSVSTVKLRCGSLNWYGWNFIGKDHIIKTKKKALC